MAPRTDSDGELDSAEENRDKKKSRHRSRSRDRKKSKKHKKEKKKRRNRSGSGDDTAGEGGDTPTRKSRVDTPPGAKLPGIGKYDSDGGGSDEDDDRRKEYKRDGDRDKEKERDREKRGDRKRKKRSRTRSRSRNRRSRSRDRGGKDRDSREERGKYKRDEKEELEPYQEESGGRSATVDTKEVISLSFDETNKLREKLGLKPLNVTAAGAPTEVQEDDPTLEGTLIPGDRDKTRHLPADHWGEKAKGLKIKEKLAVRKEKRSVESKLAAVRGIADSDSDDDAENWVQKQKNKVDAKKEAEKRAKAMAELDDEFGVGDLVTQKLKEDRSSKYTSKHLRGLRVEHNTEHFSESTTVLTLKDQNILDEKYEDVLVNVNIMDTERTKKNFENLKSHAGYNAYDQEQVDENTGEVTRKKMLYQYDEEIEGAKKESFTLEGKGEFNPEENKARELAKIRHKLKLGSVQTLDMPELRQASDYYNSEEMAAFKKPNSKTKKKKIRKKMLKADDLLAMSAPETLLPADFGGSSSKKKRAARIIDDDDEKNVAAGQVYDDLPVVEDLSGVRVDDDDLMAISSRLKKAKKAKKKKVLDSVSSVADNILSAGDRAEETNEGYNVDLILDQTQEFCRGLGETVTFEPSGLGEGVSEELLDFEESLQHSADKARPSEGKVKKGGWERVGEDNQDEDMEVEEDGDEGAYVRSKSSKSRPAILEDEALASTGMGAALKMAQQMGFIENKTTGQRSSGGGSVEELKAQRYSVEDKSREYEEDDRKRRRGDRGYGGGATSTFNEKKGYKPEINLAYLDDHGRAMSSKEAFRYLSHKFHGKTSGKIKTEKRQRKIAEDKLMQKMSSVDTPLQTLSKQVEKTKELSTPYLVLSGNKQLSSLKK